MNAELERKTFIVNGPNIVLQVFYNKMVTRKRWNSQRFLDRIPVAELEYKMVLYRKDNDRLDREHRMKKVELWNTLFRNEIDREKSVVKYHSLNEVLDGRVELTVDHKKSKETRDSFQRQ
jgi:hypothetical protein